MSSKATVMLRVTQAVVAVIVLGTIGYAADQWTKPVNSASPEWCEIAPSETIFLLTTGAFTIVVLLGEILLPFVIRIVDSLVPDMLPSMTTSVLTAGFFGLTASCWFAGFIALLVYLMRNPCADHGCRPAQAGLVFSGIDSLLFTYATIVAFRSVLAALRQGTRSATEEQQVQRPYSRFSMESFGKV